ncbi:sel1 repeat family protein [Salmonella enterica subsp. enterica serovar Cerro]|uniref:Sel1 repeat family protein n=4 Tax=Salmonella enterica TaxID=28901 RepID=A0A5T3RRL1_SALER|nr:tetratricopeptide repeat protein [Salmonella enterica]EAZ9630868.1 sel1 repeat family protein [Salmonella enterica subsp. enterica serovar Typhimurium]EBB4444108.1 sel1 repeat family protein [Salmonella enterica subsp. enterica serovar Dublin]EBD0102584.1 sel1 repeat family protein [Salmonella enterica subsp. enterica serovar Montevideo]EBG5321251.1 sel1 repeat family protein [Salmonella enterica subsp. enterica serovar Fresno]EBI0453978.1 sel1 repeat family protein [Salmonella enterica sub
MIKRKWNLLLLLGLSFASVCQAGDDIDALYSRIAQKDIQALNELKALAKDNNAQALAELGFIYEYGVAVPKDTIQAIKYYEQACHVEEPYGCYNARYFYLHGLGVMQDDVLAKELADKTSKADIDTDAQTVTRLIADEIDTAKQAAESDITQRSRFIETLRQYAGGGSAMAALITRLGYSKADILHLAELWAQERDPELNFIVGSLYDSGFVEVDDKEARSLQWFRKAAELGQADAQNILGYFYLNGKRGIKRDLQKGGQWYELAAAQGNADALINLGEIYYSGTQVPLDYARAFEFFERAAKMGKSRALNYLAWMYTNGQFVDTDCRKAAELFAQGRTSFADDPHFQVTCEKDRQARAEAVAMREKNLPKLTFNRDRVFGASQGSGYACELEFVVKTDRISSIENLRVSLALKNKAGAMSQQVIAFEPFGLNTQNRNLQGYKSDTLRESTLQPVYQPEFCDVDSYSVTAVTGMVNGKEMDMLKAGIFL